jgi:hypothetical protein
VIPTGALVTVAFSVFGRDRGHFVTCNRLVRIAVRLRGSRPPSQLYVGKRPTSEGIGRVIRRFVVMAFCSPFSGNAASRNAAASACADHLTAGTAAILAREASFQARSLPAVATV